MPRVANPTLAKALTCVARQKLRTDALKVVFEKCQGTSTRTQPAATKAREMAAQGFI